MNDYDEILEKIRREYEESGGDDWFSIKVGRN
jgi:hypothetical protein